MNPTIDYRLNTASKAEIAQHLRECDVDFVPPLSDRVEIGSYAKKISSNAARFEAWTGGALVGLVAAYCNDQASRIAHITNVSVLREWAGKGIGRRLINQCMAYARTSGMRNISLEVAQQNASAIRLYGKIGFVVSEVNPPCLNMNLDLSHGRGHE